MSKRCELQKEYYQANGKYKGVGKYSDDYVKWLENEVLALRTHVTVCSIPHLQAFADYAQNRMWVDGDKDLAEFIDDFLIETYL